MFTLLEAARRADAWLTQNGIVIPGARFSPRSFSDRHQYFSFDVNVDLDSGRHAEHLTFGCLRLMVWENGSVELRRDRRNIIDGKIGEGYVYLKRPPFVTGSVPQKAYVAFCDIAEHFPEMPEWFMCIEPADRRLMGGVDGFVSVFSPSGQREWIPIRVSDSQENQGKYFGSLLPRQRPGCIGVVIDDRSSLDGVEDFLGRMIFRIRNHCG